MMDAELQKTTGTDGDILSEKTCPGCAIRLRKVQVEKMIGNAQYNLWCRSGYCSFLCHDNATKAKGQAEGASRNAGNADNSVGTGEAGSSKAVAETFGQEENLANEQRMPNSGQEQEKDGLWAERNYPWFVGGVLVGGEGIALVAAAILMRATSPAVAWGSCVGQVVSPLLFLLFMNKRGNIRWRTAIPAMGVIFIGALIYSDITGRPVVLLTGVKFFFLYLIFGLIGIGIGKLIRKKS